MGRDQIFYTRAAKVRLEMLPVEVRMHLGTHLENLALLAATPERLPQVLAHVEDGFVTTVEGFRVLFTVDTSAQTLLVHRVESLPEAEPEEEGELTLPEEDP